MFKSLVALVVALFTCCAQAQTATEARRRLDWQPQPLDVSGKIMYLYGPVGQGMFDAAAQVDDWSRTDAEPITLIINSPGGSVVAGAQFVSAMRVAQSRGVKFKCVVPMLAASRAFIILNECDQRYALSNAMLLWHDVSVNLMGNFTAKKLTSIATNMAVVAADYELRAISAMRIDANVYAEFYEMLIPATELQAIAPDYLTIVSDIRGVESKFFSLDSDTMDALQFFEEHKQWQVGGRR